MVCCAVCVKAVSLEDKDCARPSQKDTFYIYIKLIPFGSGQCTSHQNSSEFEIA